MICHQLRVLFTASACLLAVAMGAGASKPGLTSDDLYKLQAVGDVQASPDAVHVAYSVQSSDRPGRPYSRLWMMSLATRKSWRIGGDSASAPVWSPNGRLLAFSGRDGDRSGLMTAAPDGSSLTFIAPIEGTNHPLPSSGDRFAWSPDGKQIAFISATAGPEADANGDPMVITRYLYKPTAAEGLTRFNDNRRLHIFIADVATKQVRQLTSGNYYEHSIDWSPRGDEIVFVSNRGPDPDRFFNYDLFTVKVSDGNVRRLSDTKSAEYRPKWSPDGARLAFQATTRDLTSSETTMEDTHVWMADADGRNRREVVRIDNRQGAPEWSADGQSVYFTLQERGSNRVYRQALVGGAPILVTPGEGSVAGWSPLQKGDIVYAFADRTGPAELLLVDSGNRPTPLTALNKPLLEARALARVESFTFKSFDGMDIEAFLTVPSAVGSAGSVPMIVMIHGGPHSQQGPAFNSKAQIYASQGWAALMVNYRGSTGYGQKLADAIFGDQNGGEAKDVLAGVDAALAKYSWIDRNRLGIEGGSYGGQLTNWIVTQTDRFRAAIPLASIANLVSFNYMAYYHDYLAVEFGSFPHEKGLMDVLWQRSPLRYVHNVKTPVMLLHGENDNDVPIAEAEQFYIALRDVGVESIMVRYPREGHGIRETKHVVDVIDRSVNWYRRHFTQTASTIQPPVIDHHQHLFSPAAATLVSTPTMVVKPITGADLIAHLDAAGIRRAVVLSMGYTWGHVNRKVENEYEKVKAENDWTSEQVARFPDRLRGVCGFNLLKDYALEELARCLKDPQLRSGLKTHFGNADIDVRNPQHVERLRAVFRIANQQRMSILVHMRPSISKQRPYGREEARIFLTEVVPAAPDVPIQIAHLAGAGRYDDPAVDEALGVFAEAIANRDPRTKHLYFDVSGVVTMDMAPDRAKLVAARLRQLGLERVLYGSDAAAGPNPPPREAWAAFRRLPLTEAEFKTIATNVAPHMR